MRILIVDDDPDLSRLHAEILKVGGYPEILIANSALEAFTILGLAPPQPPENEVDLVLMDISMPGINGIEACLRIKADERWADLPIIMITGRSGSEDVLAAFDAGVVDYLTKPVRVVELLARVRSALRLKQEMDRRKARERELLEVTKQLEAANQRLERLSVIDGLTEVANRRRFDELLALEWERAERLGTPLSLILADIDCFKSYNDTYGHLQGDACLKQVAHTLAGTLHRHGDMIARYGGEEFAIILPDTDTHGAFIIAERARSLIESLHIEHHKSHVTNSITISMGVGTALPWPGSNPAALIVAADRALYSAKQEGRNRVEIAAKLKQTSP